MITNNNGNLFSLVDKNTLERCSDVESEIATKCKRDVNDPWNTPNLEITNINNLGDVMENGEHEEYRTLIATPLFTDGSYLYIISTYVVGAQYSRDEVRYDVEAY